MRHKIITLATAVALLSVSLSTVGFSLLQLQDRNANISVAADDPNGLIALEPGNSSVATTDGDGLLEIDLSSQLGSGNGVNPDARLELGNDGDDTVNAFRVVNRYSQNVNVNLTFDNLNLPADGSGADAGQIEVYQSGTQIATLDGTSGSGTGSVNLAPGDAAAYDLHFVTDKGVAGGDAFNVDITVEASEA